jgi:hypothetical protein
VITAGAQVGDSVLNGAIDADVDTITVNAGGDIYLQNKNGGTFTFNSTAGKADVLVNGTATLNRSKTDGDFTFHTMTGDILFAGKVESVAGGVSMKTDTGSFNVLVAGPHVVAGSDSFLAAPNGTIGLTGLPLDVFVSGALILDIGSRIGQTSGRLTGTVTQQGVYIPTFNPAKFPQPLYPTGNVYFNGVRIWPSLNTFLLSQYTSGLISKFQFPTAEKLGITQVNVMDLASSFMNRPVYFYHPISDVDNSGAGFNLEQGAYDFIDGQISDCSAEDQNAGRCGAKAAN